MSHSTQLLVEIDPVSEMWFVASVGEIKYIVTEIFFPFITSWVILSDLSG
jgi:hypothetical protein